MSQEVKELAAEKLLTQLYGTDLTENIEKVVKDMTNVMASLVAKGLIEKFMAFVVCPLLNNASWDCGDCEKGGTPYCKSPDFLKCPAFGRYLAFRLVASFAKRKSTQKEKKVTIFNYI
ncbi:MAG: hypothetical protein ACD_9C00220G0001 [uncultured bacterium]|nr:MAG: hypothetical protein ACD_9C00220G0001 [uncultured bacterium]